MHGVVERALKDGRVIGVGRGEESDPQKAHSFIQIFKSLKSRTHQFMHGVVEGTLEDGGVIGVGRGEEGHAQEAPPVGRAQ
jgi:hypothetical protein